MRLSFQKKAPKSPEEIFSKFEKIQDDFQTPCGGASQLHALNSLIMDLDLENFWTKGADYTAKYFCNAFLY